MGVGELHGESTGIGIFDDIASVELAGIARHVFHGDGYGVDLIRQAIPGKLLAFPVDRPVQLIVWEMLSTPRVRVPSSEQVPEIFEGILFEESI